MSRQKAVGIAIGAALLLAFGYFIWPTPYEYTLAGPANTRMLRRNRFTGDVTRVDIQQGASDGATEAPLHALTDDEVQKLTGEANWYRDVIFLNLYNGSAWTVREVDIACEIEVDDLAREVASVSDKPPPKPTRRTYVVKSAYGAAPLTRLHFRADTDTGPVGNQRWTWRIVGARGRAP